MHPLINNYCKICKAKNVEYNISLTSDENRPVYPYLLDKTGDRIIYSIGTSHGRSYVIGLNQENRWIVSKGNGLSYTRYPFLHIGEFGDDTLGLLLISDAKRDFLLGQEIANLGIKTNHMEHVIILEKELQLTNGHIIKPVLLQYNVECPFRISDAAYIPRDLIKAEVKKWCVLNKHGFSDNYLIAADVMIRNLRILHDNQILHNAIHEQNYTWALELLDFELACSPVHPYDDEDNQRHVKSLFSREILQTYHIICQIADVLYEEIDNELLEDLFHENGFDISRYKLHV